MLICLSIILLLALICFIVLAVKGANSREGYDSGMFITGIISSIFIGVAFCICAGFSIFYTSEICTAYTIDEQISMYEEENAKIEKKIDIAIENYLAHENTTLTNLNPENATAILASYPELKSDTVVASQVNTYIKNHEKITSLKKDKINISKLKWWLYFGS